MGKVNDKAFLGFLAFLVVGCAPVVAGPELPRPAVTAMTAPGSTTTTPETTTTLDSLDAMAAECPSELCLVYSIDESARWSDGSPVVADDFVRTYRDALSVAGDERNPGYELISAVDVIDDHRVRVVFAESYGPWSGLFSRLIPPDEAVGGPFRLVDWVPGDSILVERVDDWWPSEDPMSGAPLGDVEEIEFVFLGDTSAMVDALDEGEVDVIMGRPDEESLDALADMEDVKFTITPGRFWEHIEFHHEDPLLRQRWLREAIALAIDREDILNRTARLLEPYAIGLNNTLFMTRDRAYVSHFGQRYDPDAAERVLLGHGCERDGSELYVCDGVPLSFIWATTTDDPARREIFEAVSEDLAAVGIEVVADFRTPSAFVSSDFILGGPERWQMSNFAWRADDDPSGAALRYACGESLLNVGRYCSEEIEDLFAEAANVVEGDARNALYNQADELYLDDIAAIPLYQKPELMAWTSGLSGLIPNYSSSSELWNVASWQGKPSIVVAIPREPSGLDPFITTDDNANRVLATLMHGALGLDPSLGPLPVLVDSVQVVEG